jgi:hypothetical protein
MSARPRIVPTEIIECAYGGVHYYREESNGHDG